MQRDKEYLLDILEAAKLAVAYVSNKTREDFFNDLQCQDAVIRRLEIIGEDTSIFVAAEQAPFQSTLLAVR